MDAELVGIEGLGQDLINQLRVSLTFRCLHDLSDEKAK